MSTRDNRQVRELVSDLASLGPAPAPPTLRKEEPRGGIPAARGYAERAYQPGAGGGGTAGIASPLVEVPDTREYHTTVGRFYSNTYLIFAEVRPLKAITFTDSNGLPVRQEFALPPSLTYV